MNRTNSGRTTSKVAKFRARVYLGERMAETEEAVTVEEPLEIRLCNSSSGARHTVSVTMRTPGMDDELTAGFLFTEGIVSSSQDIISIGRGESSGRNSGNIIEISVTEPVYSRFSDYRRNFTTNSSCGVCGKNSINEVFLKGSRIIRSSVNISSETLASLPELMARAQEVFTRTGGIHAAALFDAEGKMKCIAEDVGRHNAVDKVIGHLLMRDEIPASDSVLQLSGRAGFEMVQKAVTAGIPVISSVSAPSSLAVETAEAFNATLACFVRNGRFTVYAHPERIVQ